MPRPASEAALSAAIDRERRALDAFLATLAPVQMVVSGVVGDWSVMFLLLPVAPASSLATPSARQTGPLR